MARRTREKKLLQKRRADPSDGRQVEAAHRRALALAGYYTRLAEVLVPPAAPSLSPQGRRIVERVRASLPSAVRERMAARAAEVAESLAPTAGERRAAMEAINTAWAKLRGQDEARVVEDDIIAAVAEAVELQGPDRDLAGLGEQAAQAASAARLGEDDAAQGTLGHLRARWPEYPIGTGLFLDAVRAWRDGSGRDAALTVLLHRAGLRGGTEARHVRAVEQVITRLKRPAKPKKP